MKFTSWIIALVFLPALVLAQKRTIVSIEGEKFYINGKPTYEDRSWQGYPVEGLLFNARMVQGIFDDLNEASRAQWKYPDTHEWSADRNTNEFVAAMDEWNRYGLLAFTLNLQGGSPLGYGNRDWINSAFDENGNLRTAYFQRLDKILLKADELGMVVILGLFYFGQDQHLKNETAVLRAVDNTMDWLFEKEYRNVLIEACNETDVNKYDHDILKTERIHEIVKRVRDKTKKGYRYLATTSYGGGTIPTSNVVKVSDYILIHGNGVGEPERITQMVKETKEVEGYSPMPIVFNEDDHYDFDEDINNMVAAVKSYASWGFFDFRREGESFEEGYQSVPVDWSVKSERKRSFFEKVEEISGGN
ncbi:hypothetical protein OKW21_001463 [Catalinimonas alkaloidigena]|uniref:hypothetical protein n=1 Tax=Catalinimonas alkaloidigena TaxID=1075417 RepID=UPI0024074577|nr:hypothetical protein [Catalinimonas alkaloidigena]MDF9796200.1 hypothetical protein [Catalinimonas alkaloidigena]